MTEEIRITDKIHNKILKVVWVDENNQKIMDIDKCVDPILYEHILKLEDRIKAIEEGMVAALREK